MPRFACPEGHSWWAWAAERRHSLACSAEPSVPFGERRPEVRMRTLPTLGANASPRRTDESWSYEIEQRLSRIEHEVALFETKLEAAAAHVRSEILEDIMKGVLLVTAAATILLLLLRTRGPA